VANSSQEIVIWSESQKLRNCSLLNFYSIEDNLFFDAWQIHYERVGKDGRFSHKEVTVYFVPDLSECLPSLESWREHWFTKKKDIAERERELALSKEVCLLKVLVHFLYLQRKILSISFDEYAPFVLLRKVIYCFMTPSRCSLVGLTKGKSVLMNWEDLSICLFHLCPVTDIKELDSELLDPHQLSFQQRPFCVS